MIKTEKPAWVLMGVNKMKTLILICLLLLCSCDYGYEIYNIQHLGTITDVEFTEGSFSVRSTTTIKTTENTVILGHRYFGSVPIGKDLWSFNLGRPTYSSNTCIYYPNIRNRAFDVDFNRTYDLTPYLKSKIESTKTRSK